MFILFLGHYSEKFIKFFDGALISSVIKKLGQDFFVFCRLVRTEVSIHIHIVFIKNTVQVWSFGGEFYCSVINFFILNVIFDLTHNPGHNGLNINVVSAQVSFAINNKGLDFQFNRLFFRVSTQIGERFKGYLEGGKCQGNPELVGDAVQYPVFPSENNFGNTVVIKN